MSFDDHDSNSYNMDVEPVNFEAMSFAELNLQVDNDILELTLPEVLDLPAESRAAAIEAFSEIDPALGSKLLLEVLFANS